MTDFQKTIIRLLAQQAVREHLNRQGAQKNGMVADQHKND